MHIFKTDIKELTNCYRMQSEHPADEAQTVIRNGRVLGGLEPSRAFGDARYKWPREVQDMSVFLNPTIDAH
jgi:pyruvate dehydrogenase phosphatase